jgi:hypothetical protein
MPICTRCGAILSKESEDKHKCNIVNIPLSDNELLPQTIAIDVFNDV